MGDSDPILMTVYIGARTELSEELTTRARQLEELGVRVLGSWLHAGQGVAPEEDAAAAAQAATLDFAEVAEADVFVAVTEGVDAPRFGRGGRHVELGAALAFGKRVVVIGPAEHVFHMADGVVRCTDWDEALEVLSEWAASR